MSTVLRTWLLAVSPRFGSPEKIEKLRLSSCVKENVAAR
jgi:hypothetical protein